MKKVLLSALVAGTLALPMANAEAYHVIEQYKNITLDQLNQQVVLPVDPATGAPLATQAPIAKQPAEDDYKLAPGAKLRIEVFGDEELTREYDVRPDGKLSMPVIGDVACKGKTVPQLKEEIEARLDEFLRNPKVTINLARLGTTRVYVLGEVRLQGLYELEKSHTLLDAVAKAGGFTQKSSKRQVYVLRRGTNQIVAKVNMMDLLQKGAEVDMELNERDAVYISSNHKVNVQTILSGIYYLANAADRIDDIKN